MVKFKTRNDLQKYRETIKPVNKNKKDASMQQMLILQNPPIKDINDYISRDGYKAFEKAIFDMRHSDIFDELKKAKLRGRCSGGFPTGIKWETCSKFKNPKYFICNAYEGNPSTGSIIENNPYSIIEGMLIGGYSIGSKEGYIYINSESSGLIKLSSAIEEAKEYGFLGNKILGSDFSFNINLKIGGDDFICNETTALIEALQDKDPKPRTQYVNPVEKGFKNRPTVVNSAETLSNIPLIIYKGSEWYSKTGNGNNTGTKIFTLEGSVNNPCLAEVPIGTTIRDIVFNIGNGIQNGKKIKAVQIGSPLGGLIPEQYLDTQIDFDELFKIGSVLRTGSIIIMDQDICIVKAALLNIEFLKNNVCGQCVPCREGLKNMFDILTKISQGKGSSNDIDLLEKIGMHMEKFSICSIGIFAPRFVLSTIHFFRNEYEAHIKNKK